MAVHTSERRRKRRMVRFRIDKISSVDAGAQAAQGDVILKREFSREERERLADRGAAMSDGSFPIVNRSDLQNAIRAFGRAKDKAAAARHIKRRARALGLTDLLPDEGALAKGVTKRAALTTSDAGHAHLLALDFGSGDVTHGSTDFQTSSGSEQSHAHPWVMAEDGTVTIGEADGHTHAVAVVGKADEVLGEEGTPAGSSTDDDAAGEGTAADDVGESEGEGNMTKPNDKAAGETKVTAAETEALQKERDEAVAKAARFEKIAGLPADQRAHFDALKGEDAEAFLAADEPARKAAVAESVRKAADANPVVYESPDGTAYRKNDDPRLVKLARERDEDRAKLAKAERARELVEFRKRAGDELGNLTGTVEVRARLLEVVEKGAESDEEREAFLKVLHSHDLGLAELLKSRGTSLSGLDDGSPDARLEQLAKAHQAKNSGMTFERAYTEVLETEEGQRLLSLSPNGAV